MDNPVVDGFIVLAPSPVDIFTVALEGRKQAGKAGISPETVIEGKDQGRDQGAGKHKAEDGHYCGQLAGQVGKRQGQGNGKIQQGRVTGKDIPAIVEVLVCGGQKAASTVLVVDSHLAQLAGRSKSQGIGQSLFCNKVAGEEQGTEGIVTRRLKDQKGLIQAIHSSAGVIGKAVQTEIAPPF